MIFFLIHLSYFVTYFIITLIIKKKPEKPLYNPQYPLVHLANIKAIILHQPAALLLHLHQPALILLHLDRAS